VLAELGDDDRTVVVEHPRTGETTELELTAKVLAAGIRGTLYVPELSTLLPLSIARAHDGDYGPLLAQTLLFSDGIAGNLAEGMFLSVICAEDVPFITDEAVARETSGTMLGTLMVDNLRDSCALWDRAELPVDYREPVAVDVPTLVLSGDLDPVTPPHWGEHAAETLSNSTHVVVPGRGHGTTTIACVSDIITAFIDSADPAAVDASCVEELQRPRFFVDFAGPSLAER
jgi:pimeloyl-ACP methyl ester carboxylesterase